MNKIYKHLSLSLLLSSAIVLAPVYADAKTITWPDDSGIDPEAVLRPTPINRVANSLFINSVAQNNTLNINSGTILGSVYAAYSTGVDDVSGNTLNIYGGTIGGGGLFSGTAIGGYGQGLGAAIDNTVNLYGGTVKNDILGGMSYDGHGAQLNTVNISGGLVEGGVYGGYVNSAAGGGTATYNTINITGGTINGDIYGGDSANGQDQFNTVNISGAVNIASTATISGGNSGYSNSINSIRGNTLNMDWVGTVKSISNFEFLNFVVSDDVLNNDNTVLKVTASASINYSQIKITSFRGAHKWSVGDQITILSRSNGTSTLFGGSAQTGLTHFFDYDMVYDGTLNYGVLAKISGYRVNDAVADLPSGTGSTNSFLKSSADLIDSADMLEEIDGLSRFIGVVKHSRNTFGSGSTADVNGTSMLLGFSTKYPGQGGYIMLGGFVEAGWGSYNTNSNFDINNPIQSQGKTNYHGLGIAARNIRDNGIYTTATVRLGRAFTRHQTNNLTDSSGNIASYDMDSMYYGLNLGVGKNIKLSSKNNLDIYGKYLFLHQTGSNVTVLGDQINFNDINSHRLRAGAKITHQAHNHLKTYVDIAYEYELNGAAKATASGSALPYISIKGGTAIAELGFIYKPKNEDKFETKMGIQGYTGKRRGMSGNIELKWKF